MSRTVDAWPPGVGEDDDETTAVQAGQLESVTRIGVLGRHSRACGLSRCNRAVRRHSDRGRMPSSDFATLMGWPAVESAVLRHVLAEVSPSSDITLFAAWLARPCPSRVETASESCIDELRAGRGTKSSHSQHGRHVQGPANPNRVLPDHFPNTAALLQPFDT